MWSSMCGRMGGGTQSCFKKAHAKFAESFGVEWFLLNGSRSRSFDSAEVRFAQDDRSFIVRSF